MKNKKIHVLNFYSYRNYKYVIFAFFFILSIHASASSSDTDDINTGIEQDKPTDKKINHNFYLGAKLGVVFLIGVELEYILQTKEVNRFYLAASVQSSVIFNSANAGGGIFLGKTGLAVGCRYHHLLWLESEKESNIEPGYGPEVIWTKTVGTKYVINLHAGGIITKNTFFPDISFGLFIPLNK